MVTTPDHVMHVVSGGVETPENTLGSDFAAAEHTVVGTPTADADAGFVLPTGASYSGVLNATAFESSLDFPFTVAICARVASSPSGTTQLLRIGDGGAFNTITIQGTSFDWRVLVQRGATPSRIRTFDSASSGDVAPGSNVGDLVVLVCRCLDYDDLRLSAHNISADAGFLDFSTLQTTPASDPLPMTADTDSFEYAFKSGSNFGLAWVAWWSQDITTTDIDDIIASPHDWWEGGGGSPAYPTGTKRQFSVIEGGAQPVKASTLGGVIACASLAA